MTKLNCARLRLSLSWLCVALLAACAALSAKSYAQTTDLKIDPTALCKFVKQKRVMTVAYYYDPADAPIRVVGPHALGYTSKHNISLFGRQVAGYSKSAENGADKLPGWRNFRLDRIKSAMARSDLFVPVHLQLNMGQSEVSFVELNRVLAGSK